jgi:hypothetical protein
MQTAALACLSLDLEEWDEARVRAGSLEWLVLPEELAED